MAENNPNEIHIGRLIQAQLKADQRSVSWLASQIPCTRNHLYKIFRKDSLDCALLLRISLVMQFNFFRYYSGIVANGMKDRIGEE
jgi:hypothetical protein